MKSKLVKILVGLAVVALLAFVAVFLSLNSIVKQGVLTVGPEVTKVSIALDGVGLSVFSGAGEVKGLVVGNPAGFKTPSAIKLGTASLRVKPASLLGDKIVVESVRVEAPEITFEGDLSGSNLGKIQQNVDAYVASLLGPGGKAEKQGAPGTKKKLQVDEIIIANAKVNLSTTLLGGKSATLPLPEIKLANLGQGPDGITPAEVIKVVLTEVTTKTLTAVSGYLSSGGKLLLDGAKGVGGTTTDAAKGVTKSLGDMFKKKETPK